MRWITKDEVVELANATEYGLTAVIWTNDIHRARRVPLFSAQKVREYRPSRGVWCRPRL